MFKECTTKKSEETKLYTQYCFNSDAFKDNIHKDYQKQIPYNVNNIYAWVLE